MSTPVTPAKRPSEQTLPELSGQRKWQKSSTVGSDNAPPVGLFSSRVIRVLFSSSNIGGIIGKGGSIISQIREETGAKIRVEENVPGCDERLIIIGGSSKENESLTVSEQVKTENKEIDNGSQDIEDKPEECGEGEADAKQSAESEKYASSVQKALLAVFGRMVDLLLSDKNEGDEGSNKASAFVVRLLVFSSQVGCLLGKGGSVIKQMSSESGAQIRILPKDELPSCASSSDELLQITGGVDAVRKALLSVSQLLLENPPPSHSFGPTSKQDRVVAPNRPFRGRGPPFSAGLHDIEPGTNFPPEVLSFKLLCSDEKIGGVIGKGGCIIKGLKNETGCDIRVLDGEGNLEDRIIIISGPAYPDARISAPQDAVLRVQARICSKDKNVTAKLLVSTQQIGCLLGKGGSVIFEMRKSTGAGIRILGKDQVPKTAAENEEVVQVTGELEAVQEALLQITSRLKNLLFGDVFPHFGHHSNPGFVEQIAPSPFASYIGRVEFSPSGTFPDRGPPFNKLERPGGPPPPGSFHPHNDRTPFGHGFPRSRILPHMSERAEPWGPEGPIEGPGPMGFPDYPGAPHRRFGGFPGGNQPAVITNTTVEVVVPRFVVPAIYGEDGGCLRQIREISDAKITIMDPQPGATETIIKISGTPEQTNAAQSLIQAFVINETQTS